MESFILKYLHVHSYRYNNKNNQTICDTVQHSVWKRSPSSSLSLVMSQTLLILRKYPPRCSGGLVHRTNLQNEGDYLRAELEKRWIPNRKEQDSLCKISSTQNCTTPHTPQLHSTTFLPFARIWQNGFFIKRRKKSPQQKQISIQGKECFLKLSISPHSETLQEAG